MANNTTVKVKSDTLPKPDEEYYSKPTSIGKMTRAEIDAELLKGVESLKTGKTYTQEEIDIELAKEFGNKESDNEISTFCLNYPKPVSITKNRKGDLVVMNIESYEEMTSRFKLYGKIKEGIDDIAIGNIRQISEAMADIRRRRSR